jgi:hypothetical protein
MFKNIAAELGEGDLVSGANKLFDMQPKLIADRLQEIWDNGSGVDYRNGETGDDLHMWGHLIYAYMIENTRIFEIFERVIVELLHGEKLGIASAPAQKWVRITEELFYKNGPHFYATSVDSNIRPDLRGSRRNAYQRMFGMDLNHGKLDGSPYPYVRAIASNNEFVSTLEEFLREIWVGLVNLNNTAGAKATDKEKVKQLGDSLNYMLLARRLRGTLFREEFAHVATLSWFDLSVHYNSPIIETLKADATSPEQRLFKIAQLVQLPGHGLSRNYFSIADNVSLVLILIELGYFTTKLNFEYTTEFLFDPNSGSNYAELRTRFGQVITHWSAITGRDLKSRKVVQN